MVKQFYIADEISRKNGQKIMLLLTRRQNSLSDIKEAYLNYKKQNSEKFLCFSKFAELQQRTVCWLEQVLCMQFVCVCTIHQNV
jgi:hypothetical protein